ncbi:MAG TPA: methylmalonyl-CoA mutase family protein [Candidatus Micrarchaeaceae archaeon]|nr:methylmalonyl-CoA mutase family protein [Candidatus Micrarchaeaceae archaeon]
MSSDSAPPRPDETESQLPLEPWYGPGAPEPPPPGEPPYTRGLRPDGYRRRLWTMRQYAGFGSASSTNERFHYLLDRGQTGLSVAFDLPTQMGYDSDAPEAAGEVGKVGVAIDTLEDMKVLCRGLPLDRVTTSMTINAPASLLLLMYQLAGESAGIAPELLGGTIQNDILKEYVARGTYIFPPRPSMRLVTDTLTYCHQHLPRWHPISISGYHMREAGATAPQELAFALSDGIAYVEAALSVGLKLDDFAPQLSFFFNVGNDFFEEVAKFRAARELWSGIMRERFGASGGRSCQLRFHAQTGGATLTAQQPLNNVVRVSLQALAAVLGGAQSLHTNSFDEALALPSEQAASLALRTQQLLAFESGVARVADPLGGSHFLERLTEQMVQAATRVIREVDERGGAVAAIEQGYYQDQIQDSAYRHQQLVESGERVIVGVNRFQDDLPVEIPILKVDPELERGQRERLARHRQERDPAATELALGRVQAAATGTDNLLPVMRDALLAGATLGEICSRLRLVFGSFQPRSSG